MSNKFSFINLALVLLLASFNACNQKPTVDEPLEVGRYVFKKLKVLPETSIDDYIDYHLPYEKVKKYGGDEKNNRRWRWFDYSQVEWNETLEDDLNDLKYDAGPKGLKWSEIEYLDFAYSVDTINKYSYLEGELFFEEDQAVFSVDVNALTDGTRFEIFEINHFYEYE